jgi:GT2 family glycosyltransferase
MIDAPMVSIVILNWNGWPDIQHCVECSLKQDYPNTEVMVVDNGSTDGSLQKVEAHFPRIRVVRNSANLGFARGMNVGIAASEGKYVIPLNQDAFLGETFVRRLVDAMESKPGLGAASPTVVPSPQGASSRTPEAEIGYALRKHMRGIGAKMTGDPQYVLGPSGCCPFLRRKMLDDIALSPGHYYDEDYVTGGEDIDLYLRMQLRGWSCIHVPEAIAQHVGSGSVGGKLRLIDKPLWYQRNGLRNRYLTILGDLPGGILWYIWPYILIYELGIWPYLLVRSPKTLGAVLWAWVDIIRATPEILRKRRFVQSRRLVDSRDLLRFFIAP